MSNSSLMRESLRMLKPHLPMVGLSMLLGVIGGLCVTGLLAAVNRATTADAVIDSRFAIEFAALCLLAAGCNVASNLLTNHVGQRVLAQMRYEMAQRIITAPIAQLEQFGSHKLVPVLTHDVSVLSSCVLTIAPTIASLTVTLGGVAYMALLSWQLTLLMLAGTALVGGTQWFARRQGLKNGRIARSAEEELQKYYETLSSGAKELRMQRGRRHHVLNDGIGVTTDKIRKHIFLYSAGFAVSEAFSSVLFFAVIGVAIFLVTLGVIPDQQMLAGFILVALYINGPLEKLTYWLPVFTEAQISLQRTSQLAKDFSSKETRLLDTASRATPALEAIELRGLRYVFPPQGDGSAFELGPIDLSIRRGDITFIVGENGSGKTTLIKLLLGLYEPHHGSVILNGQALDADTLDDYRQLFTTVFSDYHLFDELPPATAPADNISAELLQRLELAHKISIDNGRFSTTALSTGQRKRLALLNAWLEQRDVLVFDEWAADQDPSFRQFFYRELLAEFKQLGKTIIVISHDDRYFDIADQLIRMDAGKIVVESGAAAPNALSPA